MTNKLTCSNCKWYITVWREAKGGATRFCTCAASRYFDMDKHPAAFCEHHEVMSKRRGGRRGQARREMERRLRRQGVHPDDIKVAVDFIERAKRRDASLKGLELVE